MKYTINDIAKLAGVSKATVSRVINGTKPVSSTISERVLRIIKETGFKPSQLARSLSNKQTKLIGVIVPDFSNPIFSKITEGIEMEAIKHGYSILLCNGRLHPETEINYLDVLLEKEVDGLIYNGFTISEKIKISLEKFQVPIVMIGINDNKLNYPLVKIDNFKAAYEATNYLIKNGHTIISMIHGPKDDPFSGKLRLNGFLEAIKDNNLETDKQLLAEGHYKITDGYNAMKKFLNINKKISAIFCANDEMAIGAIKYITDYGLKVPDDISIMGFDNIEISSVYNPSLTTISQPFVEKGKSAMKIIISIIAGEKVPQETVHNFKIVCRDSVKKIITDNNKDGFK